MSQKESRELKIGVATFEEEGKTFYSPILKYVVYRNNKTEKREFDFVCEQATDCKETIEALLEDLTLCLSERPHEVDMREMGEMFR